MQLMQTLSPQRIQDSNEIGNFYEKELAPALFRDLGWTYEEATRDQNMRQHFDFICNGNLFVEVKAPKKYKGRKSNLALIEHTNVKGKRGWLRGEAGEILQYFSETKAIKYSTMKALEAYDFPPKQIERLKPEDMKIQQWVGRVGRKDIFRYEKYEDFISTVPGIEFLEKIDGTWQRVESLNLQQDAQML